MKKLCVLVIAALLSACGGPAYHPQFKPAAGDKRTIQQDDQMTISVQVMGQTMPMNVATGSAWQVEVIEVQPDGEVTLRLTADRLDMGQDMLAGMPGLGIDMSFLGKAAEAVKGQSFTAKVGPGGEVRTLEGLNELNQHVMSKITLPTNFPGGNPRDVVQQALSDSTFRRMLESWFSPYQPAAAKPASSWSKSGVEDLGMMEFNYQQTYTLAGIENGIAKVNFEKTFSGGGGGSNPMGMPITMTPSGGATGVVEMDAETGWIRSMTSTIDMTVKGSMENAPDGMGEMDMKLTGNSIIQMR